MSIFNKNEESKTLGIEEYIERFKCCNGKISSNDSIHIKTLFRSGYCYSFALMLKQAFPDGGIYLAWPCAHIVFGLNGKYYDIDGVYKKFEEPNTDTPFRKPIPFDSVHIPNFDVIHKSFLHCKDVDYNITTLELINIYIKNEWLNKYMDIWKRVIVIDETVKKSIDEIVKKLAEYIRIHFDDDDIKNAIGKKSLEGHIYGYFYTAINRLSDFDKY